MKYTIANRTESNMSCLQGYVKTTYNNIINILGEPHTIGDKGDKISAQWIIKINNKHIATIYDYKEPSTPLEEYDWHIGGHNRKVVKLIGELLGANTSE